MKKVILFAAFAVVAFATQAQVKFGAKAGLNLADWSGADASGTSTLASFHVGGLVNIAVSENFSVQPEVLYSGEGAKVSGGKYVTSYINVPVLAQYKSEGGFYGETGPQIGLLMSAKAKASSGGGSTDIKDELKSSNFSWAFGAGYQMASGLGFNARYNLGLSNVVKDSNNGTIKTSNIAIGVSYTFGGAKSSRD